MQLMQILTVYKLLILELHQGKPALIKITEKALQLSYARGLLHGQIFNGSMSFYKIIYW
jgi:hypothetical protein